METDCEFTEQQKLIARRLGISTAEYESLLNTRLADKLCLHCQRRMREKRLQYCTMQPSKRTLVGYVRVHAHDNACGLYKEREVF